MADRRTENRGLVILDIADVPFGYHERVEFQDALSGNLHLIDQAAAARLIDIGAAPADSGTLTIVAALKADGTAQTIASQPDVPRNLQVTYPADWDGGDVIVSGTDARNRAISESIPNQANATKTGSFAFKTITSVKTAAVGTKTGSMDVDNILGVSGTLADNVVQVFLSNTSIEAPAQVDVGRCTVRPASEPDGSRTYRLLLNILG